MKKPIPLLLAAALLAAALAGCASSPEPAMDVQLCSMCSHNYKTAGTGWCDACKLGFVNGELVLSRKAFERALYTGSSSRSGGGTEQE